MPGAVLSCGGGGGDKRWPRGSQAPSSQLTVSQPSLPRPQGYNLPLTPSPGQLLGHPSSKRRGRQASSAHPIKQVYQDGHPRKQVCNLGQSSPQIKTQRAPQSAISPGPLATLPGSQAHLPPHLRAPALHALGHHGDSNKVASGRSERVLVPPGTHIVCGQHEGPVSPEREALRAQARQQEASAEAPENEMQCAGRAQGQEEGRAGRGGSLRVSWVLG